jgi:elongator complex protein 2
LTATRLRFSSDDRYLLSVGRDRQWAVFERENGESGGDDGEDNQGLGYKLLQANPKGHTRMILDAAWVPSTSTESGIAFATAGRDKTVKIWRKDSDTIACVTTIPETHPVTAIDFLPRPNKHGQFVLAVGTEAGKISIHSLDSTSLGESSKFTLRPEYIDPSNKHTYEPHTVILTVI